jgi:hypothetical protein
MRHLARLRAGSSAGPEAAQLPTPKHKSRRQCTSSALCTPTPTCAPLPHMCTVAAAVHGRGTPDHRCRTGPRDGAQLPASLHRPWRRCTRPALCTFTSACAPPPPACAQSRRLGRDGLVRRRDRFCTGTGGRAQLPAAVDRAGLVHHQLALCSVGSPCAPPPRLVHRRAGCAAVGRLGRDGLVRRRDRSCTGPGDRAQLPAAADRSGLVHRQLALCSVTSVCATATWLVHRQIALCGTCGLWWGGVGRVQAGWVVGWTARSGGRAGLSGGGGPRPGRGRTR